MMANESNDNGSKWPLFLDDPSFLIIDNKLAILSPGVIRT